MSHLNIPHAGALTFAGEPVPAEQKEKKDMIGGKADDEKRKYEKKDMGGR